MIPTFGTLSPGWIALSALWSWLSKEIGIAHIVRAGVKVYPHLLRHTFAISYLCSGGDILTLQQIMGHQSIDTLQNYVKLAAADLEKAAASYSPADRLANIVVCMG